MKDAMQEKFKAVEEKENEVRQIKTLLRERDRDIERANQMLLTAEESIDVSTDSSVRWARLHRAKAFAFFCIL